MRKLIGCFVLVTGVGGVGYVATTQTAVRMQQTLRVDVSDVAHTARHPLQTQVSGRDVTVTGLVTDPTERATLLASIVGINGVRVVDVSGVQTLPRADPFEMIATLRSGGPLTLAGTIPSETDRDVLANVAGNAVVDLTLAAGEPDSDWTSVAAQSIAALGVLKSGDMTLTDRSLTISGTARNPDESGAALAVLASLPDSYTLSTDIDVEDDGTPLRLELTLQGGAVTGTGKFPAGLSHDAISDRFETAEIALVNATIPATDPQWHDVARTALDALSLLIDGTLTIQDTVVTLAGTGDPDGVLQAQTLIDGLPASYSTTASLALWDDGAPVTLNMVWDGTSATASGKFPAGFTPQAPDGDAAANAGTNSFLPDDTGRFAINAAVGTTALGLMATGTLIVTGHTITLTGSAASPQVAVAMDDVLANAAPDTGITRDLSYLDDGTPAAWTLRYDAADGAMIEGRLPLGLAIGDIDLAIGLETIQGTPATALDDDNTGTSLETLQIVADYLPEIETLTYARDSDQSMLDLVLAPGVDLDLVAADLAERLPADVAFSLSPLDVLPPSGTARTNTASGVDEVFASGFWLPLLAFDFDLATCEAKTLDVLETGQIGFLSSTARLNATSIRTINALAAVVLPCVTADFTLEVSGHTDATGDEIENNIRSQNRANAVRAALIERGVPDAAVTAYGFGQNEPIADNETPEGRAANRRTDITWYAPGALRDP